MARPKQPQPTARELEILQVLWDRGDWCTAREVVEALNQDRQKKVAYTSVLTFLGIMQRKGFVIRDASERSHRFRPFRSRQEVEDNIVARLVNDVFGGSAMRLVTRALSTQPATDAELEQIQRLLDDLETDDGRSD